ncbi:MAG TPA: primosomal protein N' [Candidatus Omnitrophota bacterium]|nr:primosomal protein N' [Candidatus Omnitrophota bacterium]
MLFAKVVVGLAVSGPFDYIVPAHLESSIKPGCRVKVNFRNRVETAYVVSLEKESTINKLKEILALLDDVPVLNKLFLDLTKEISNYYCCTWGEAIETALPDTIRKGKPLNLSKVSLEAPSLNKTQAILLYEKKAGLRWDVYIKHISSALASGGSAIIIVPDVAYVLKIKALLEYKLSVPCACLYRKQAQAAEIWAAIKNGAMSVVIGTRSAVFAPTPNTKLIIVDEEQDFVYKQDQVPHYHARDAALMRARLEGTNIILGSQAPSMESMYLARAGTLSVTELTDTEIVPDIKIIDMNNFLSMTKKKNVILSRYLEDAIAYTVNTKGKTLLFLNRKGFATKAACQNCQTVLTCPSCETNLAYYYATNTLECTHCTYTMPAPTICPSCNSGYIRYSGLGTGKMESELSRIFPQAKIEIVDSHHDINSLDADIYVSTSFIIKALETVNPKLRNSFDLVATLNIDASLNRHDFRATEKTFLLLTELKGLAKKSLVIQTKAAGHYCFKAIALNDTTAFFDEELAQRAQLDLPPCTHFCHIKVRGKLQARAQTAATELLAIFKNTNTDPDISFFAVLPGNPPKLRGNYYFIIHAKTKSPPALSEFLKKQLREIKYSGIIITVDMDPI